MSNEHASRRWMISHKTHFSILITWFSFFFLSWNMTYICKFFDGKLAKNFWVKLCMPKSKLLAWTYVRTYLFVPMFPAHCKIRTLSRSVRSNEKLFPIFLLYFLGGYDKMNERKNGISVLPFLSRLRHCAMAFVAKKDTKCYCN